MSQSPDYSLELVSERRLDDRLPVSLRAEALEIGGSRLPVEIKDLSRQGAMFESVNEWKVGARVWVFFSSGLAVSTKVVWASRGRHGCQFLQRLSKGEMLLAQSRGCV
jgi:hypothetical protein